MMKSQMERLHKNELQSLHINRRLLQAIAEEVVESKENQQQHQYQQHENEQANEEEEAAQVDPSTKLTTSALLGLLCSAMDASSSTLQEVWINDDVIQYCSKSNDDDNDISTDDTTSSTDNKEKEEYAGTSNRLLHTLTTLPCLRRLRFYLSSTMTKAQSEYFMQLVAPTIRACTLLQSLHFCLSNSSRPAPAAAQQQDEDELSIHQATNNNTQVPSIILVGFCLTPTALHTLASVGLENHASLSEFGLQDVMIVQNHKPPPTVTTATSASLKFPLDPILLALASLPQLETVDISLSKPVHLLQPPRHGLHRGQPLHQPHPKPVVASTSHQRPCYFSGRALGTFFQKARLLQDCTLWDVGLKDDHLSHYLLPALQFHPRLQFLSLRGNPGMTRTGWMQFYEMLLNGNYTLRSLFHDGGFGDDVEHAMDQVLYWNLLGRGRLFSSSPPSPSSSSNLPDSASSPSLSSLSLTSSSSTTTSTSSRNVHDDSTRSDWIDMLENVNDDVTSLYYFLRQGNAILMPPTSSS